MKTRCSWCGENPMYIEYHDKEWGVPVHDDRLLFEFLTLEGAQAGLGWITILKKRENYREAFHNFDYHHIAKYTEKDIEHLLENPGIVRNKLKIRSVVKNAIGTLNVIERYGSFNSFLWRYVNGVSQHNERRSISEIPAETATSKAMSKDLKKLGFNFVGPTICYAFMQAVGMVNDHTIDCFRYQEIAQSQ